LVNYQSQELLSFDEISKNTFGISVTNNSVNSDLGTLNKENFFSASRPIYGFKYERVLNNHISFLYNVSWGKLSSNSSNENFESSIIQSSIENVFYFKNIPTRNDKLSPYFSLGIGGLRFNSYTDKLDENGFYYNYWDDGSIRDISQEDTISNIYLSRDYEYETKLKNDSINYSNYSLIIPASAGIVWNCNNLFNVKLFLTFNQLLSDWLDNISEGKNDHYFTLGFSINLFFSKERMKFKKEKKEYLNIFHLDDSDFDGVLDHNDRCQKTPKEVNVLENGCPFDSDFDGFYDYEDLEPYSESMLYVDELGRSIKNITLQKSNIVFDTIVVKEVQNFIK
jgi:hypothetical protein